MDAQTRKPGHGPNPGILLRVSEHFLRRRRFEDCRQYAQQAYRADPNFPGVSDILAVANVLTQSEPRISSGTLPDWYAVLQIHRYSQDSDLIRQRFDRLYSILNPSRNKFPFANEAFDLICDAWYVLSNPLKKSEFDELWKEQCGSTFWTVCPYCYYLYEYPRVYVEHCLRCPNEKCSKGFTCVEIDRPPVEVMSEGKYSCAGFLPVGFGKTGLNSFAPSEEEKGNASNDDDTESDKSVDVSDDGDHQGLGSVSAMRKKESVANEVPKEGFVRSSGEDTDLNVRYTDEYDFNSGFLGGATDMVNAGEVEFYDAEDDVLVSLQDGI